MLFTKALTAELEHNIELKNAIEKVSNEARRCAKHITGSVASRATGASRQSKDESKNESKDENKDEARRCAKHITESVASRATGASRQNKDEGKNESKDEGKDILGMFQAILDTKKQYMFLVRNTLENRIVCQEPDRPTLYHVGTFVNGKLNLLDSAYIPYPKKHKFKNIEELLNYVEKINCNELQGLICFAPNNTQFKIFNQEYQEFFRTRGNEPSVKFRYLQVRMDPKLTDRLYFLYKDKNPIFDAYENFLYQIAKNIYSAYVERYIHKKYITLPNEEFNVMKKCHTYYLKDRTANRITLNQVIKVMNEQSTTNLNHMIRHLQAEIKERNNKIKEAASPAQSAHGSSSLQQGASLPECKV